LSEANNAAAELPGCQLSQEPTSGSHLTRTLGLHKDTPALAPFLGKQAARRGIREFDNGGVVDIDSFEINTQSTVHGTADNREKKSIKECRSERWRMPYMHRNDVERTAVGSPIIVTDDSPSAVFRGDEQMAPNGVQSSPSQKSLIDRNIKETATSDLKLGSTDIAPSSGISLPTSGTRFHFVARIVITDRSLWIPPGLCHPSAVVYGYL
jgi:hypothetical protein